MYCYEKRRGGRKGIYFLLILIFLSSSSYSQLHFTVTPLRKEHYFEGGKKYTEVWYVENLAEKGIHIKVEVKDFDATEDGDIKIFLKEEEGKCERSLTNWITVQPTEFDLKPYQRIKVRYTLNLPKDKKGTYWCIVLFTSKPIGRIRGTGIKIGGQVGAIVYQTFRKDRVHKLEIEQFKVIKRAQTIATYDILLVLNNTGNALLRPNIRILIKDQKGRIMKNIRIEDEAVLPDRKRRFEKVFDLHKKGVYKAELEIKYPKGELKKVEEFTVE